MFFLHPHIIFVVFFCCIFCNTSYGQKIPKTDSLRHSAALKKEKKSFYQTAYEMYQKNIKIFETKADSSPQYRERIARSYLNAGNCMKMLELTDRAAAEFNIAIKRYNEVIQNDLKYFTAENKAKVLNRFGNVYYSYSQTLLNKGEITKARDLNEQAAQWYGKANYCKSKVLYTNHIANVFREEYDHKSVIEYAKKALQLFEECDSIGWGAKADILIMLGLGYEGLEQYNDAIREYSEALKYTGETREDSIKHTKALLNIGFAYTKKKELEQAKSYLNQALKIRKRIFNQAKFNYWYASVYEDLADIAMIEKDYEDASNLYETSIDNLKDSPTSEAHYIYNKPDLLRVLDLKAQAALKSGNTDLAYNTYKELDNWTTEFYKDLSTNESKLTWIARAHNTYGHAIEVALKKGNKEKAFQYAEKAHAVLLWQSLSQQAARNLLSEEDKEKMDDLTAKIRQADQQYRYEEIKIEALRTLEREQEALEKTFDEKYPEYEKRKYQPEATTVNDIQKKIIDHQTAFIEYYQTDETLYIFTITKNGLEVTQKNAKGLADDIADFVKNISNENMNIKNYHTLAHKLYQQLIPKSIPSSDKINRIVIVPDREIGTLPFAALATQDTSGKLSKNTAFLVKKYATNYLYSAGSYLQLQQQKANQEYCFAGIAPGDYEMEKWKDQPLNQAIKELESIKSLHWFWEREILTEEEATKAAFEKIIKDGYKTILISTHAAYGENGGEIAFRDSILTQDAIDMLEINTHRLILSACETGVGKQNQGEGILSLGWNFAYKGVPSITMTHWKVNSGTTKDIIVSYSENLNKGVSADQALRKAQLEYLRLDDNKIVYFQPHYWAGFFHTGNIN